MREVFKDIRAFSPRTLRHSFYLTSTDEINQLLNETPPTIQHNTFEDPPGMYQADSLLGPPNSNRGITAVRFREMDTHQTPTLPKTTKEAFRTFVPLFVPITILVDGKMLSL